MPKWAWICIVTIMLSLTGWSILRFKHAEINNLDQLQKDACNVYFEKDWVESEKLYHNVIESEPKDKLAWYRLGVSQHYQGKTADARDSFLTARDLGFSAGNVYYNISCTYAVEGDVEESLFYLERSIQEGFDDPDFISKDPDLKPLHKEEEFIHLIKIATSHHEENDDDHDILIIVDESK